MLGELFLQFKDELGGDVEELGFEALAEDAGIGAVSPDIPLSAGLPPLNTGEGILEVRLDDSLNEIGVCVWIWWKGSELLQVFGEVIRKKKSL